MTRADIEKLQEEINRLKESIELLRPITQPQELTKRIAARPRPVGASHAEGLLQR
jgi:hypothetical protein